MAKKAERREARILAVANAFARMIQAHEDGVTVNVYVLAATAVQALDFFDSIERNPPSPRLTVRVPEDFRVLPDKPAGTSAVFDFDAIRDKLK